MVNYLIKTEEGIRKFDSCYILSESKFNSFNKIKIQIIKELSNKPMFISELAKKMKLHEQNVYYHVNQIIDLLEIVEEKKVRGTIARKFKPKSMNFCLSLSKSFKDISKLDSEFSSIKSKVHSFFFPFIDNGELNAKIVVGSPDPHGQYKARSRDGHYAIDLALYIGSLCRLPKTFSVSLDTDISLDLNENIIVVGGPVTNLLADKVNSMLPVKFVNDGNWVIKGKKDTYSDDNVGLISRIVDKVNNKNVILIAGLRFSGTKSAVIALTRQLDLILNHFSSQNSFYAIVQGYDMDGDGKVDTVELLESI
ncbi:MAG: S-layer protein [Candidatus Woesearchaeota archaeon]